MVLRWVQLQRKTNERVKWMVKCAAGGNFEYTVLKATPNESIVPKTRQFINYNACSCFAQPRQNAYCCTMAHNVFLLPFLKSKI